MQHNLKVVNKFYQPELLVMQTTVGIRAQIKSGLGQGYGQGPDRPPQASSANFVARLNTGYF